MKAPVPVSIVNRSGRAAGCLVLIMAVALGAIAFKLIMLQGGSPTTLAKYAPPGTYGVVYVDFRRMMLDEDIRKLLEDNMDAPPEALKKMVGGAFFVLAEPDGSMGEEPRTGGILSFRGTTRSQLEELVKTGAVPAGGELLVASDDAILTASDQYSLEKMRTAYSGETKSGLAPELRSLAARSQGTVLTIAVVPPKGELEGVLARNPYAAQASSDPKVASALQTFQGFGMGISLSGADLSMKAVARTSDSAGVSEIADSINDSLAGARKSAEGITGDDPRSQLQKDLLQNTKVRASGGDLLVNLSVPKKPLIEATGQLLTGVIGQFKSQTRGHANSLQGTAARAVDTTKVKTIAVAIQAFRAAHGGAWPTDLKALVDGGHIEADVLLLDCEVPPLDVDGLKTSYLYIGAPLPAEMPERAPILFAQKGTVTGGRTVLYADMTTEWRIGARLVGIDMQHFFDTIVQRLGDKATEERQMQLRRFFGIADE